jgi:type IV secretion system protein VirB11
MNAGKSFLSTYLRPLRPCLDDPRVVEVAINPDGRVWVERQGDAHMVPVEGLTFLATQAQDLAQSMAASAGVPFSEKRPVVSGKIMDGSAPLRVQVVSNPVVEGGCSISMRRYSMQKISMDGITLLHGKLVDLDDLKRQRALRVIELAEAGDVSAAMRMCIEDRLNIVISGGTSTGKTTFARGLLSLVDPAERIVTIEDAYELFPEQPNFVSLKSDRAGEGEKTPAKLLEACLRMRPDRIILGELRGEEAKVFLEAINTGHGGSVTTLHADTALKSIDRLALMVMSTGLAMSFEEVRRYCANSIDLVVQLGRIDGRRGIAEIYLPSGKIASLSN